MFSKSDVTGEISYKRVVNTFIRQTDEIYKLTFTNSSLLETTWNHPFRRFKSALLGDAFSIENSEWVEARNLKKGDQVYSADGSLLVVESVIIEQREETVYNFEVEDFHTYFVGEDGVWVHNDDCYLQDPSKYNIAKRSLKGITDEEILEAYGGDIDALGLFRAGQSNEAFLTNKLKQLRNQGIGETEIENQLVSDILKIANTSGIKDTLKLRAYIDGMRDVLVFEGYAKEDKNFKLTVGASSGSRMGRFGKYPASQANTLKFLNQKYGNFKKEANFFHSSEKDPQGNIIPNPTARSLKGFKPDPNKKDYIWVGDIKGNVIIGEEYSTGAKLGHPTLNQGQGRIGGEFKYENGNWIINSRSGRFGDNKTNIHQMKNYADQFRKNNINVKIRN